VVERSAAAAALEAASGRVAQLIERWNRESGQADQARIEEFKAEARRALQEWARVSDEKLGSMRQRVRRGHGLMSAREAQDHWELLNQLKNDVYRYVEDRDSLLADYEPLTRAAAPEALQPFWELFDAAFEKLEWHKGSLLKYEETYRQQPAIENRNYEIQSRDDSRAVRDKLREFIDLARPLMEIIGKL
jgi:hypothetical protein